MKPKPVTTRLRADEDIDGAFESYLLEGSPEVAEAFINEFERVVSHLSRNPLSGSTRLETALVIPGLRLWPLRRFPYLVIYVDREHVVEIWRVLHSRNDIPEWMRSD